MSVLQRLLLIPLLAPLAAVLLVAGLNPRPAVVLRLLIWTSPALPIGAWLALAAVGGAGLSAAGSGLALRQPRPLLQRRVRAPGAGTATVQTPPVRPPTAPPPPAPARAPGEPPPTVEVPFRVIRRGRSESGPVHQPATKPAKAQAQSPSQAPARPTTSPASGSRASATPESDGWDQPLSESWD